MKQNKLINNLTSLSLVDENYIKADMLWLIYETGHDTYIKKGVWRHERDNRDTPEFGYDEADFGEWEEHCQGQNKKAESLINLMTSYCFYNYLINFCKAE